MVEAEQKLAADVEPGDALRGFVIVMLICALASTLAIRAALQVDPASAIGA